MLAFYDMVPALAYHIVPGIYMASDLEEGMELPTARGPIGLHFHRRRRCDGGRRQHHLP